MYHCTALLTSEQAVGLGGVCGADFLGQQTEEDGCHLSTGNAVLRTNGAVRIAYNVSIVVIAVQTGRYIIRNGNGGLAAAAATAAAGGGFFRIGIGEYGVLLNLCIADRGRIPGTSTVAGVRLVAYFRDRGDRNHNVFERFAGFIVLERNVNNDVSAAAVIPLAVYNLECKTVLPRVRDAVAGLVRLLTALDVKVVVQVDGNVLGQLFKVIGNLGQTRNVNVVLAVNGLVYRIILVKLSNQRILIAGLGLTVLYLNLNVLLVVEVLVDGVMVRILSKEALDDNVALDFKILCIFGANLPTRERMALLDSVAANLYQSAVVISLLVTLLLAVNVIGYGVLAGNRLKYCNVSYVLSNGAVLRLNDCIGLIVFQLPTLELVSVLSVRSLACLISRVLGRLVVVVNRLSIESIYSVIRVLPSYSVLAVICLNTASYVTSAITAVVFGLTSASLPSFTFQPRNS